MRKGGKNGTMNPSEHSQGDQLPNQESNLHSHRTTSDSE